MKDFLEKRNNRLIRDIETIVQLLNDSTPLDELLEYRQFILARCEEVKRLAEQNLHRLQFLAYADILEDLISETQKVTEWVRSISALFAVPVLRASKSDRLSLQIIQWLHQSHTQTANYFPAFRDGDWSVLPFLQLPIYSLPSVDQRCLLYQPLSFHEFGHVLYACHERELDDLVRDLQEEILELLSPNVRRNDLFARRQAHRRQVIAAVWYKWILELFCDAVGFTIGGPSFLYALSSALSDLHPGTFFQHRAELRYSTHPVRWLRIQFLTKRAEAEGFVALARHVEKLWCAMSEALGIVEDYHGFYDGVLEPVITRTIEDMLTETSPRHYRSSEVRGNGWVSSSDSPIRLLNWAWQTFLVNPGEYRRWEDKQIVRFICRDDAN